MFVILGSGAKMVWAGELDGKRIWHDTRLVQYEVAFWVKNGSLVVVHTGVGLRSSYPTL